MTMYIAHRGNLEGRLSEHENDPNYIDNAINQGYMVEVDLWCFDGNLKLGHDEKFHHVPSEWLFYRNTSILNHCKNPAAFDYCLKNNLHAFWHTEEDYVQTTLGYTVGYPGKEPVGNKFILGVPERVYALDDIKHRITFGVMSDYVKMLNT